LIQCTILTPSLAEEQFGKLAEEVPMALEALLPAKPSTVSPMLLSRCGPVTLHQRMPKQLQRTLEAGPGVLGCTRGVPEQMYSPGHAPSIGVSVPYHHSCGRAGSGAKDSKGNYGRKEVKRSVQSVSAIEHWGVSGARSGAGLLG
jgi:hypothetical protein